MPLKIGEISNLIKLQMLKMKYAGIGLGVAMALAPFLASAATISDARFSNNQTNIDATGGANVSGTFTLTVGAGEVVEWFRSLPAGNPFTEQSVGGQLGYQEGVYTNVPFNVKVPPNTGTYNVDVQGAGIYGGNRAINGGDNVVLGATSVGTVRVVASGSSGSSSSDDSDRTSALEEAMANLAAQVGCFVTGGMWTGSSCTPKPLPPTAPAPSNKCSMIAPHLGAPHNTYSASGVQLQSVLLLDNPFSIPALKPGSSVPMGWRGVQTNAALSVYMAVHSCN